MRRRRTWNQRRPTSALAIALGLALALAPPLGGCDEGGPEGGLDCRVSQNNARLCGRVVLDLFVDSVASSNFTASPRRHFGEDKFCWSWRQVSEPGSERIDFELTRVFSIGADGTRYGCRFKGSGNPLRGEFTEGACLLEQEGGHLRLELSKPASIQIHDLGSTQVTFELAMEERREEWILQRGRATLDFANQTSLLVGVFEGEEDLDVCGPSPDPWGACPAVPLCFETDFTGAAELFGESVGDAVCEEWLASAPQYGRMTHRLTADHGVDWFAQGTSGYPGVRDKTACTVHAFQGSMDTRNDYRIDLSAPATFSMALRAYHQTTQGGAPITRLCRAWWSAPLQPAACP